MNFSLYLNRNSDHNRDYSMKKWNRCKEIKHKKNCRCDFQEREKICSICDSFCIDRRTLARVLDDKENELLKETVGPFEFRTSWFLLSAQSDNMDKDVSEEINKSKLDDIQWLEKIRDDNISLEQIVKNFKELMPLSYINTIQG